MPSNNRVVGLINAEIANYQQVGFNTDEWCVRPHRFSEAGRRRYLGGSQLGSPCRRQRWYEFHWVIPQEIFDPRVLRLFDRGHREEERFVAYLRMIGVEVQEYDPDTIPILWHNPQIDKYAWSYSLNGQAVEPWINVSNTYHEWIARDRGLDIPEPRQFSFTDFDNHHSGHGDGRARNIPDYNLWDLLADEWVLLEFKTHNDRSFNELANSSVYASKYAHYVQVQCYMHKFGLRLCLYMAVNKNNDELYAEYIPINQDFGNQLSVYTRETIYAERPPPRISNSPSWYECRWCGARPQCHFGAPQNKNCRSCFQSVPVADGRWHCNKWGKVIPLDFEPIGCDYWHVRDD